MADVLVLVLDPGIWSEEKKLLEDSKINESLCSPKVLSYVEIDISALLLFVFTSFPLLGFLPFCVIMFLMYLLNILKKEFYFFNSNL